MEQKIEIPELNKTEITTFKDFIEMCQKAIIDAGGVFFTREYLENMTLKEFSVTIATNNKLFIEYKPDQSYFHIFRRVEREQVEKESNTKKLFDGIYLKSKTKE